jgi:hypothetical protein
MSRPSRINPDSRPVLIVAVSITAILAAVSFALSYSGLVAVAAWAAVPAWLSWAVPVTIDGAILVSSLAALVFRARGESARVAWLSLSGFTSLSVAANAAHAWESGTGDIRAVLGATIAGLAPVAVLLTTHTIARLVVAPPALSPIPDVVPVVSPAQDSPVVDVDERDATILRLRHEDRLSLRAIADRVGVSKTTVTRVLNRPTEGAPA